MQNSLFEKRAFNEMLIIVVLMLISALFFPPIKGLMAFLPIIYFLVESRIRGRARSSIGLNRTNIIRDVKKSWVFIVLVGIILQVLYFMIFKYSSPEMFVHTLERASFIETFDGKLLFSLLILALGEEIVFRGLIQGRFSWVMKPIFAIALSSLLFALMHISNGDISIIIMDLSTVFIDSIIFGIIFYKTNNIYTSWIAHSLANITAAFMLIYFV